MDRKECLKKATETVCEDREGQYGSPEDNFSEIARLWSVYMGIFIRPEDVAMMIALLKIARIKTGSYKEDSYVDLAGYAACGCEIGSTEET